MDVFVFVDKNVMRFSAPPQLQAIVRVVRYYAFYGTCLILPMTQNVFAQSVVQEEAPKNPIEVLQKVVIAQPSEAALMSGRDGIQMEADEVIGQLDNQVILSGQAVLDKQDTQVRGDRIEFDQKTGEVRAIGQVKVNYGGHVFGGDAAKINVDRYLGSFENMRYQLKEPLGHGVARSVTTPSDGQLVMSDTIYTACNCEVDSQRPDWYLRVDQLDIDRYRESGQAKNATLYFLGVPILATPYLSFPLNDNNQSGLLPPTIGVSSRTGVDIRQPLYYSIAPNRDFTLYPRIMAKRGLQLGAEFRYLEKDFNGEIKGEYIRDLQYDARPSRYAYSWVHDQKLANFQLFADVSGVSDDDYPSDFSYGVTDSTQKIFPKIMGVRYQTDKSTLLARMQKFQYLSPASEPYERPFQVQWRYQNNFLKDRLQWRLLTDYSYFHHSNLSHGSRWVINQSVSYPIFKTGYFMIPQLDLHAAHYRLNKPVDDAVDTKTRLTKIIPTASFKAGAYFDKELNFNSKNYNLSFEPEFLYAYTPEVNQDAIPIFDTTDIDFGQRQMQSQNRFLGYDRVSNNNSITLGVTARLSDDQIVQTDSLFYLTFLQRYYLSPERVYLSAADVSTNARYSDWFLASGVMLPNHWRIEADWQYDFNHGDTIKNSAGLYWQPEPFKRFNMQYRYSQPTRWHDSLKQLDTSFQWPISRAINLSGRVNYDFIGRKIVNGLLGIEYERDCWNLGLVFERYVSSAQKSNNSVFLRLQLVGLSTVGSSTHTKLKENIKGFNSIFENRLRSNAPQKVSDPTAVPSYNYLQRYEIQ